MEGWTSAGKAKAANFNGVRFHDRGTRGSCLRGLTIHQRAITLVDSTRSAHRLPDKGKATHAENSAPKPRVVWIQVPEGKVERVCTPLHPPKDPKATQSAPPAESQRRYSSRSIVLATQQRSRDTVFHVDRDRTALSEEWIPNYLETWQ
ncbi:hypothetical protein PT974_05557 [Cladobotryum mycophilum]|uniref:Uncharacterized protein n=1 Tax=Cladobotryum mycophilum TaxID=491253 RepID=A0ABR0SJ07_9HYPO